MKRGSTTVLLFSLTVGNCLVNSPYPVYLALYAKSLGFSATQWTVLNTVMILLVGISLLWVPALLHKVGARLIMLVTFVLMAACFASITTGTRAGIVAGALAFGVLATASSMCVITELQKGSTRLGRLNSIYMVINGGASVVGPVIAALLVQGPGYRALWLGSLGIMAMLALGSLLFPGHDRPAAGQADAGAGAAASDFRVLLRSGIAPLLLGTAILEPFSFQMYSLYSSLRLSALGLSDAAIGYVSSAGFAVYLSSSILAFFFLDRMNIRVVVAVFLSGAALSCAGFGLAPAVAPAVAAVMLYQLFYGWLHPAKNTRLAQFATSRTLPAVFSWSLSVQSFSAAGVGAVASALVGAVGMQPLIAAGALVAAAGAATTLGTPRQMQAPADN